MEEAVKTRLKEFGTIDIMQNKVLARQAERRKTGEGEGTKRLRAAKSHTAPASREGIRYSIAAAPLRFRGRFRRINSLRTFIST